MHVSGWTRVRVLGLGAAVAALAAGPAAAAEDSVEAEIRQMRELVLKLQDQVDRQQTQIEEQSGVIRDAGLEDRGSLSTLSSFLEKTDFSGSIATSYFYNTDTPGSGGAGGVGTGGNFGTGANNAGGMNPFHPDHNSIQFDQLWLSMSRATSDESPVGFGIDLVFGAVGEVLGTGFVGNGNALYVGQAYLEYENSGVKLTAGKFFSHIGYEVVDTTRNINITRGFTFNAMQPFDQIGVKLSGDAGGFSWMVGAVNGIAPRQTDIDGIKDFIWQLGYGTDMVTVLFNGEYGGDAEAFGGGNKDNAYILNGVVEITPSDSLVVYSDVTYNRIDFNPNNGAAKDVKVLGIAAGGRAAITDRLGLGGRLEWASAEDDLGGVHTLSGASGGPNTEWLSTTGTVDFLIVDGLTARAEIQWQKLLTTTGTTRVFDSIGGAPYEDDQLLVGAQLFYAF